MDAQPTEHAAGSLTVARHLIRAMRPVQWVKNVFVFAPLVFGLKLLDTSSLALSAIGFVLFCLISSAVYLLNDISDREQDAQHPVKRHRPIASGALPVEVAWAGMFVLVGLALGGGLLLDVKVALVLAAYLVLNIAYTAQLKHLAFIDITCIALGFLLRVVLGSLAIAVEASGWLLACTFLLASLLALGKRRHELISVHQNGRTKSTRAVLDRYQIPHIDWVMRCLAVITVISYTLYTVSETTVDHFNTASLVWSVPFVLFGLWRFSSLVERHSDAQSPTDTMVRDIPFLANVGAWAAFVMATIYFQW